MSNKTKYILYSVLDYILTFGGSSAVILYNYITPTNSMSFKVGLTGILLLLALVLVAKSIFEKSYRNKLDVYLKELGLATDNEVKAEIGKKIDSLKMKNDIYNRLVILLPFILLYAVTFLAIDTLQNLQGTLGFVLIAMGVGSVFNIIKKPAYDKMKLEKITKKVNKRKAKK